MSGPTLIQTAAIALRESATVHDAERLPGISDALRALADALDAYRPVEPGPCPASLELKTTGPDGDGVERLICHLRATHAGMHQEAPRLTEHGGIVQGACWEYRGDEVDVEAIRRVLRDLRGTVPEPVPMRVAMALEEIAGIVVLPEEVGS